MTRLSLTLTALSFLFIWNVNAQDYETLHFSDPCWHCPITPVNDWGFINQGTISKKFNENVKGEFNVQTRIMDQFTTPQTVMFEPGIKVKLNKYFAVKSAFRYSMLFNRSDAYRIHLAGYYVWHKEGVPLRVQLRTRVESENTFFWRNRLKVAGNIKGILKPYASFEVFNQFGRLGLIDIHRLESGIKWEAHEDFNFTFMYRRESNLDWHWTPTTSQVLGLMINYAL